jgi:hypothetical protein
VEWGGHAVHYIYDTSLSWLDTITSVESSLCISGMRRSCSALYIWQLPILAWYKNFSRKCQTYVLVEWGGHAVHYIYDSSLSWLVTRTSVESSLCLSRMRWSCSALYIWQLTILACTITSIESSLCISGMRRSCSALYIWQLTILAWYKNFNRKFQIYVLVEWGGHAVHCIYDQSLS